METEQTPAKKSKDKTVAFRLTIEEFALLERFAKADGYRNVSAYMRALVAEELSDRLDAEVA
jgi:hypothetical protein